MSEEEIKQFSPFEQRVLAAFAELRVEMNNLRVEMNNRFDETNNRIDALDGRLTALEDKVDARLRETRPIWENVLTRVKLIDAKLDVLGKDLIEVRAETDLLKQRLPPAA
ncbi:MAG: hypothetical protein H0T45_07610 [Pyrinomonadaceae bacterium]|nr:hypothetical protein [Pyrinomonadaceae bacterium]